MQAVIIVGTDTLLVGNQQRWLAERVVGGITLLQRAARSAQQAGATHLLILGPDAPALRRATESDDQLHVPVVWHTHSHPLANATTAVFEALDHLDERFWLTTADRVFTPEFLPHSPGPLPLVIEDQQGTPVGTYLVNRATVMAWRDLGPASLAERVVPHAKRLTITAGAWHPVREPGDEGRALPALMRTLRKKLGRDADGLAAYFINRPISLRISGRLVNTRVTPNEITASALAIGVMAAVLVSTGSYVAMALGGVALQISSILDGVDGELARMRMTTSRFGEWFDTVSDNIINISFLAGLGFGVARTTGHAFTATLGVAVATLAVVACLSMYREFVRAGIASHNHYRWNFEEDSARARGGLLNTFLIGFSYLGKRDSYTVLFMVLLGLGCAPFAFYLMATSTAGILAAYVIQKTRAHRQPALTTIATPEEC